jgi:hypothetical protein
MTKPTTIKRGRPPKGWRRKFLAALRNTANVRVACDAAEVGRSTAYRYRDRDAKFAERWDDALDEACDALELEARRRAVHGVERETWVRDGVDERGRPSFRKVLVREYSDNLLMFLLRAARPEKYRENYDLKNLAATLAAQAVKDAGDGPKVV